MVHPLPEQTQTDEKATTRLNSLEQKMARVENDLLRTSIAALEKRVAELETSLKESNQECDKLKQTIAHLNGAKKDVIPSKKENIIDGLICKENIDKINNNNEISDLILNINKEDEEEEVIYERILKLIKNMESDCHKAIHMKIPTESQLPKAPGSRFSLSKPPSPTDGLTSPSKMLGRPYTPISTSNIPTSSIPTSRVGTPSPPNATSTSFIQSPTKISSLQSPSKVSHLPSRSNTPSRNHSPPNPVNHVLATSSLNKKQSRARLGSWPTSCSNIPSRPNSPQPPQSNIHSNLSTGIPSALPQYRRQVTC